MTGILVFNSLAEAISAGYQVYGKTSTGYAVRTRTSAGWAMALVEIIK